jgi:hypothetical protein
MRISDVAAVAALGLALSYQAPGLVVLVGAFCLAFMVLVAIQLYREMGAEPAAADEDERLRAALSANAVADSEGREVNLDALPPWSYEPDSNGEVSSLTEHHTSFFSADDSRVNPHHEAAEILRVVANSWDGCASHPCGDDDEEEEDDDGDDAACWTPGSVPRIHCVIVEGHPDDDPLRVMLLRIVEVRTGKPPSPDQDDSGCSGPYAEPTIALLWAEKIIPADSAREETQQQLLARAFGDAMSTEEGRSAELAKVRAAASGQALLAQQLRYNGARLSGDCATRLLATPSDTRAAAAADSDAGWQASFITPWEFAP